MKDLYAKERAEQQLKNKEKQEQKDFFEKLFLSHKKELEELSPLLLKVKDEITFEIKEG